MSYLEQTSASPLANMRNEGYTHKMPLPPRIYIPPAVGPQVFVGTASIERPVHSPYNLDFLNTLNFSVKSEVAAPDWPYDKRREAQEILPFLYLGPFTAAKDSAFLQKEGITMVLGIRYKAPTFNGVLNVTRPLGIHTAFMDLVDEVSMQRPYVHASLLINEHLATLYDQTKRSTGTGKIGKVLVFCESGNERSAAVAAAYLMEMIKGYDHVKAMQLCGYQRFCCCFTDDIKESLLAYYEILKAKRTVADSGMLTACHHGLSEGSSDGPDRSRAKRSRPLSYDGDGDAAIDSAGDNCDRDRFEGRHIVPFTSDATELLTSI